MTIPKHTEVLDLNDHAEPCVSCGASSWTPHTKVCSGGSHTLRVIGVRRFTEHANCSRRWFEDTVEEAKQLARLPGADDVVVSYDQREDFRVIEFTYNFPTHGKLACSIRIYKVRTLSVRVKGKWITLWACPSDGYVLRHYIDGPDIVETITRRIQEEAQ